MSVAQISLGIDTSKICGFLLKEIHILVYCGNLNKRRTLQNIECIEATIKGN